MDTITRTHAFTLAALIIMSSSVALRAQTRTVVKQATRDSWIAIGSEANAGADPVLRVGPARRALVAFDLSDISLSSLTRARLVLTMAAPVGDPGPLGPRVASRRLLAAWTEGSGSPGDGFRGEGDGATWRCARDLDISSDALDCFAVWQGGDSDRETGAPVRHEPGFEGEVSWDVTADVQRDARFGWLLTTDASLAIASELKTKDGRFESMVTYHSREGAAIAGEPDLGPRLVLDFDDAPPRPPQATGTAVVVGSVYHARTREPMAGATITAVRFPTTENAPVLSSTTSRADGSWTLETSTFEGSIDLLVQVRARGFVEALRRVRIMVGRCWRVADAYLDPASVPVVVRKERGGLLQDQTGEVMLMIPPGALREDSAVAVTTLSSSEALRDELPPLVARTGSFIDISGVFGESTDTPVTMRVPNIHDLPLGTRVPFGKVDHNTLEWQDLRDAADEGGNEGGNGGGNGGGDGGGDVPIGVGIVVPGPGGSTLIEVKFDHFCSVCTGYCLPMPPPDQPPPPPPEPPDCPGPGDSPGNSVIDLREGSLSEEFSLPAVREFERPFALTFAYFSGAADPEVTLATSVNYNSTRPVERTLMRFRIEGLSVEAAYGRTEGGLEPQGTFFWDGRNALGERMPTGAYDYSIEVTSLNADAPIAITDSFGGSATQVFPGRTYPGLTPLRGAPVEGRVVLVDSSDSPYGAGWSLTIEERLHFDPDGCIVLVRGNSHGRLFRPRAGEPDVFEPESGDVTTLFRRSDGTFERVVAGDRRHFYSRDGLIERIVDRFGYVVRFAYRSGRLVSLTTATGYRFDLEYDRAGKLSSVTDSSGRMTRFDIDGAGDLVGVVDPEGATRSFSYDDEHHLLEQRGERGERSVYVFESGRVVTALVYDVDGETLLRRRDFEPSSLEGELGRGFAEGLGSLAEPIPPGDGRDVEIDGRGATRRHESDSNGHSARVVDALERETLYSYTADGRLRSMRLPNGLVLDFEYDDAGRLVVERDSTGAQLRLEFDGPFGLVSRRIDAHGAETVFEYDELGNVIRVTDALLSSTHFFYEDSELSDRPTRIVTPGDRQVEIAWDTHGNLVSYTDVGESELVFRRDASGNVVSITDVTGATSRISYDALNRRTSLVDPIESTTRFSYVDGDCGCSTSNLTAVTFDDGSIMRFEYDGLNRMVRRVDRLGRESRYEYDAEGNLVTWTNRNGERVHYDHDAAGQLIAKDVEGGEHSVYGYDALGLVVEAADSTRLLEFDYDPRGRVVGSRVLFELTLDDGRPVPVERGVRYGYTRAGYRSSMTDESGTSTFRHDILGRLESLTDARNLAWGFEYDADGRLALARLPGGMTSRYAHDGDGRVTSIVHARGDGEPLSTASYSYDAVGRVAASRTSYIGREITASYEHDEHSRLVGATSSLLPDGAGRANDSASYEGGDRLAVDSRYEYTYDAEGRLVRRLDAASGVTTTYRHDAEGRLLEVTEHVESPDGPLAVRIASYSYDPFGRRSRRDVGGVVTHFIHDGANVLHEIDDRDQIARSYTHGPSGVDRPLAVHEAFPRASSVYLAGKLGNVLSMATVGGEVVQEYVYDPFGSIVDERDPAFVQPYTYTGRELDRETGLYHYRARSYDSEAGRFISEDPIGLAGGLNPYAYVGNAPLDFTDPTGLIPGTGTSSTSSTTPDLRLPPRDPNRNRPDLLPPNLPKPKPNGGLICDIKKAAKACEGNPLCDLAKSALKSAFGAARGKPPEMPDLPTPKACENDPSPNNPHCPPRAF